MAWDSAATGTACCAPRPASTTIRSRCAPSPTPCSATASRTAWRRLGPAHAGRAGLPAASAGVSGRRADQHHHHRSRHREQLQRRRRACRYEQQLGSLRRASIGTSTCADARSSCRATSTCRPLPIPRCTQPGPSEPRFANNAQYQSIGDSWYNGMTVALTGGRASWGSVRLSYTFSKGARYLGELLLQPAAGPERRRRRARAVRTTTSATAWR